MNFKKIGHKFNRVRKIGNKVAHGVGVGLKKSGKALEKGSVVLKVGGMVLGQPEIVEGAELLGKVGKTAQTTGSLVEKTRKGNILGAVMEGQKAQKQIKGLM